MKKLFSLVLVLALVLSCVPAVWGANETADITGTNGAWPDISSWSGDCTITIGSGVTGISGILTVPSTVTKLTIVCNNTSPCTVGGIIDLDNAPVDFELVFTGDGTLTTGNVSYDDLLSITGIPNVTLGRILQSGLQAVTLTLQDVTCGGVFLRGDGSILEVSGACSLLALEDNPPWIPTGSSFTLRGDGRLTIGDLSTTSNAIFFRGYTLNLDFIGDLTLNGEGGGTSIIHMGGGSLNFLSLPNSLTMQVRNTPTDDMIEGTIDGLGSSIPGLDIFGVDGVPTFYWQKPTPPTPPTPPAPETDPRLRDFGSTGSTGGDYWPSLETLIQTQPPAEKQNPGMGGK